MRSAGSLTRGPMPGEPPCSRDGYNFSMAFLKTLFDGNEREVVRLRRTAEQVNALESEIAGLDDAELAAKTVAFKERLSNGATLDELLPEAFAVVREAGKRVLGMRHFD